MLGSAACIKLVFFMVAPVASSLLLDSKDDSSESDEWDPPDEESLECPELDPTMVLATDPALRGPSDALSTPSLSATSVPESGESGSTIFLGLMIFVALVAPVSSSVESSCAAPPLAATIWRRTNYSSCTSRLSWLVPLVAMDLCLSSSRVTHGSPGRHTY